jgi:hypothetical protein
MRKSIASLSAIALFSLAGISHARDPIDDGKLQVKPYKDTSYEVGEFRLGKAEFFGYVGDLKDSKKITGIVLLRGDKATAEQKHVVFATAQTQQLEVFIDEGGNVHPLTEAPPVPATAPAPAGQ